MGGPVKLEDGTRLKVPTLCEGHALRHPNSDFIKQITKGGDGMPAFKDKLSAQQITDMISFIRHEFQNGMTPPAEHMKSPVKDMKMN
jgi:mono/diheme cytochrome c family protein